MMPGIQKVFFKVSPRPIHAMIQKRFTSIHSKPPKGKVGPIETVFGLTVFALGLLTPAGWILLHLPKQRSH